MQRRRRTSMLARYLDKIDDDSERKAVLNSVTFELKDLKIDVSTVRNHSSGATGGHSNPGLSPVVAPHQHPAHGARGRRSVARRFRGNIAICVVFLNRES